MNERYEYKEFNFAVSKLNLDLLNQTINEIKTAVANKKAVPYKLIQTVINLTNIPASYYELDKVNYNAAIACNNAEKYFNKCDRGRYNFRGNKHTLIENKPYILTYTLQNIFYPILIHYYTYESKKNTSKKDTLKFFYKNLKDYRDNTFNFKDQTSCGHYRLSVMAGYLTMLAKSTFPDKKKKISPEELFRFSRRTLEEFNK